MNKQCPSVNLQVGRLLASPSSSTWRQPSSWRARLALELRLRLVLLARIKCPTSKSSMRLQLPFSWLLPTPQTSVTVQPARNWPPSMSNISHRITEPSSLMRETVVGRLMSQDGGHLPRQRHVWVLSTERTHVHAIHDNTETKCEDGWRCKPTDTPLEPPKAQVTRSLAWATYSSRRTGVPSLLGPCHCTAHVLWCVLVHAWLCGRLRCFVAR